MTPEKSVFVSYARQDAEVARLVYRNLQDAGCAPWMDEFDLLAGQEWPVAIQKAIANCRYFLALLSSRSVSRKGYVQTELSRALTELDSFPDSQIYLMPARIDDCEMPRQRLRELHWVDLFPDWNSGVSKILKTIVGHRSSIRDSMGFAPLEYLKHLMNLYDSPPYGNPRNCQLDAKQRAVLGVWGMSYPENIAEELENFSFGSLQDEPSQESWVLRDTSTIHKSIDGFWSSRWGVDDTWQIGTGLIRSVGDWVLAEVQDESDQYLIRARRDGRSRLVGRYLNCARYSDTAAWVGSIVDNSRIDGFWGIWRRNCYRWDFRR